MPRITLDLDEDLLARAQEVLGTSDSNATIERALHEVIAVDARRKSLARLQALDPDAEEVRGLAWGE